MAYLDSQHDQAVVAQVAEHAVIPDAVAPLAGSAGREALAVGARVVAPVDVLVHPEKHDRALAGIHLAQLAKRLLGILEPPAHRNPNSCMTSSLE